MIRFVPGKVLTVAGTMLGLAVLTFLITNVAPGDPARLVAGPDATRDMVETVRREAGLDKPLPTQLAIYHLAIKTFDGPVRVLNGIDLALAEGQTPGIVGESGCGKTVLARTILGIGPERAERILFEGRDVDALSERAWRALLGVAIAMIFQDPMTCLNPLFTVGRQLGDALAAHAGARGRARPLAAARRARAAALLVEVGLGDAERILGAYPTSSRAACASA